MHGYETTVHDFFSEEKWTSLIAGYRAVKRNDSGFIPYSIYRGLLFPFEAFVVSMCFTAAVISIGNTAVTIQAIHVGLLVFVGFLGLTLRLVADKMLIKTFQTIRSGIYHYNETKFDDEHNKIKEKYVNQIRNVNSIFKKLMTAATLSNAILVPLIQFIMVDESSGQRVLNPYLPQPVYMPFNTRTVIGYAGAFIINILFIVVVVTTVTCMDTLFISCTLQLKAQFEILNYSLKNLEKRAYYFMAKGNYTKDERQQKHSFHVQDFHDCIYMCFRSNILHHQALLQLKFTFEHFLGFMFLIVVALSSFILAAHVILILERPEIHIMANFIATLLCEMLCALHFCWCGEELTSESSEVYYSLYFTPWYNCDSRFKKLLSIMLSNTRSPVHIKTPGFDITASLNSFGSIISTMYQVMNLVRNTQ